MICSETMSVNYYELGSKLITSNTLMCGEKLAAIKPKWSHTINKIK